VLELQAGQGHACARLADGAVTCWGNNHDGQLGDDTHIARKEPKIIAGLAPASKLAVGESHACIIDAVGEVWCWGANHAGQLGSSKPDFTAVAIPVPLPEKAIELGVGNAVSCAVLESRSVMCWGANLYGEAGGVTIQNDLPPTRVEGVQAATQVAVGFGHACALIDDGTVQCWGNNLCGQRGDADTNPSHVAHTVDGIRGAISLVARFNRSRALLSDGTVSGWGVYRDNCSETGPGRLSHGSATADAVEIAGGRSHECARLRDGTLRCWGYNTDGQLGNGAELNPIANASGPAPVLGLAAEARHIASSGNFTCAALVNGEVSCWGNNFYGQLGWGGRWVQDLPVEVQGLPPLAMPGK